VTQTTGEHGQALVDLRQLLVEQASAMQAEHARIGEKIESIVDIVGMVGETVHHIAAVALQPKAPPFGALPTRPSNAAAPSITDRPMQASPQPAVTVAPRILPARSLVQQPSPPPATTVAAEVAVQPVEQPASTTVASPVAAQPTAPGASAVEQASPPQAAPDVTATRPRLAAVPAHGEPDPAPAEPSHQAPSSTATGRGSTATTGGSTLSRSLGFIPAAPEILTVASMQATTPTPRQLRAEAAARERSRLDEALDLTLDDSTPGDAPDPSEVPHA
jgi:hypothetical protein